MLAIKVLLSRAQNPYFRIFEPKVVVALAMANSVGFRKLGHAESAIPLAAM